MKLESNPDRSDFFEVLRKKFDPRISKNVLILNLVDHRLWQIGFALYVYHVCMSMCATGSTAVPRDREALSFRAIRI